MRRFAMDLVGADHPLRSDPKIDLDRILDHPRPRRGRRTKIGDPPTQSLRGCVPPRSRKGAQRGRVYSGDVTHHLDVLAQLAVILDEFPDFHDEIVRNSVLLSAASKVALGDNNLTPSETDAVARSKAFTNASSPTGGPHFRRPALGRYLAATARLVRYPADIAPLVYFASVT